MIEYKDRTSTKNQHAVRRAGEMFASECKEEDRAFTQVVSPQWQQSRRNHMSATVTSKLECLAPEARIQHESTARAW
jgi:hypothetical protein